jgi:shikimate kinase
VKSVKPVVVLVGPPGSGKSTIGELLAGELGVSFRDTDADIENVAGKPIPDIFVDEGEDRFRELERAAVETALSGHDGVLSLGGGAVLSEQTRAKLKGHNVIFLNVELGEAVSRVGLGQGRPLLMMNPRATLRYLMEQRRPLYTEVAAHTIDTTGKPPADLVAELVKVLA